MYTEQQKKEYQAMRRKRYADQQDLRTYLKGGFEMDKDEKRSLLQNGNTPGGDVLKEQRTGLNYPRQSVVNQGYKK